MPVEKVFTRSFRRSLRPKYSRRSPARTFQSGGLCSFDCSQRFSHAVKSSSRMTSDATHPIRCFTCIGSRRTLNPATYASPSVMSARPVSNLIIVVLPAPFGPRRPKTVPEATFRVTWSTAVSFPYTFVRFSVTIALSVMGFSEPSFRQNVQRLLSHLDDDPAELVRLLRGHLAHVRLQELPRGTELSEEGGPFRTDRGLEGAEALLDLLAAASKVRFAVAGDSIRLAAFLAAHGEVPFPEEAPHRRRVGARARLVEPVVAFLDRLDDLVPVHRTFLEQVKDQTLEVALPEEMEESAELLRAAHDASSRRRYKRMARTPPTIAYPAKTRREVAGSGTKPTSPPPGPGRTAAPPRALAMIPDAEGGMNHGSTFASGRIPPMMLKIRVNRKNVRTVAATVPFNTADRRYPTPTTAVMYPSV